ncbi:hypothetical protein [Phytoactinopolyspora limicola]|uniref:hypothetical protein n=1 Tax=Phytoactinopolyspora limicola TaxID=2715536 RepID=UPI00140A3E0F|nr:hypothetical protein [Phytoactinopolyspora limicola]
MSVHIRHVVTAHQVADAVVTTPDGRNHRIGHHPADGWRCYTCDTRNCRQVATIRDLIPDMTTTPAARKGKAP